MKLIDVVKTRGLVCRDRGYCLNYIRMVKTVTHDLHSGN